MVLARTGPAFSSMSGTSQNFYYHWDPLGGPRPSGSWSSHHAAAKRRRRFFHALVVLALWLRLFLHLLAPESPRGYIELYNNALFNWYNVLSIRCFFIDYRKKNFWTIRSYLFQFVSCAGTPPNCFQFVSSIGEHQVAVCAHMYICLSFRTHVSKHFTWSLKAACIYTIKAKQSLYYTHVQVSSA